MRTLVFPEAEPNLQFAAQDEETLVMTPSGRVYGFSPLQAGVLKRLDGRRELEEVARLCQEELGEEVELDDLSEFVGNARDLGLLSLRSAGPGKEDAPLVRGRCRPLRRRLLVRGFPVQARNPSTVHFQRLALDRLAHRDARGAAAAAAALLELEPHEEWVGFLHSEIADLVLPNQGIEFGPMRVTISLLDPDALLKTLQRWVHWCFSGWGLTLWLTVVVAGLLRGPPMTVLPLRIWLRPTVLATTYGCLAFSLVVHELSHALTCRHYGGPVRRMGIGWMFTWPICYADVTSSYMFRRKGHRLLVSLAGSMGQLFAMALASFAWHVLPPSDLRLGIQVFLLTEWIDVLYNLIPFMRTDGYYFVSDLLGITNLGQRSTYLIRQRASRYLVGNAIDPSIETPRTQRLLLSYAALNLAYLTLLLFVLVPDLYRESSVDGRAFLSVALVVGIGLTGGPPLIRGVWSLLRFCRVYFRELLSPRRSWRWALPLGAATLLLLAVRLPETSAGRYVLRRPHGMARGEPVAMAADDRTFTADVTANSVVFQDWRDQPVSLWLPDGRVISSQVAMLLPTATETGLPILRTKAFSAERLFAETQGPALFYGPSQPLIAFLWRPLVQFFTTEIWTLI